MMAVEIAYGSSLEALRFASEKGISLIMEEPVFPPPYEKAQTKEEWATLYFNLLLGGQTIGGDSVTGTHVAETSLNVVCKGSVVNKVDYEKLYVFSDKNIFGLPSPAFVSDAYTVIDHLRQVSLSIPHVDYIETPDKLAARVHIHRENPKEKTQIYAISFLNQKELRNFDFSDTMVRFKCEDLLRENGFSGSANGKHKRTLRLETIERSVVPSMHRYADTGRIKFFHGS
jgi:hypothetical protein